MKWKFQLKCFDVWAADGAQRGWGVEWKKAFILQPQWQCGSNCYLSVTIELIDLQLFTSIYSPADLFLTRKSPSHLGLCLSL